MLGRINRFIKLDNVWMLHSLHDSDLSQKTLLAGCVDELESFVHFDSSKLFGWLVESQFNDCVCSLPNPVLKLIVVCLTTVVCGELV